MLVVIGGLVPFDLQDAATGDGGPGGVSTAVDTATNLVLLAPLGFLVALARRHQGVLLGVAAATAVSALIEVGQAVVVSSRNPSWRDFVANVVGGVVGALAGAYVHSRRTSSKSTNISTGDVPSPP